MDKMEGLEVRITESSQGNLQCRKPKETELIPRKTKPNKEGSKHLMGSHIVKRFLL